MTINTEEYRSRVGLDSLYVAAVTKDDSSGYVSGTPEFFAPAAEASAEPAVNRVTQFADDQAYDAISTEGETTLNLSVTNVPLELLARITGRVWDVSTGRLYDQGGIPPYYALMFRSRKTNGKYRYYSFLKGRFDMPKEEFASQADKPDPKVVPMTFTAMKTIFDFNLGSTSDGVKRVVGDEDANAFSATSFFTQVQVPGVATPAALNMSAAVPADGATGVLRAVAPTLTYNNKLNPLAIQNVTLLGPTNAVIACTITLNAAQTVITITPGASLAATTAHTIVASGIKDIYNQVLTTIVKFTTGAS
jgi:phi13 family phage major tail protein